MFLVPKPNGTFRPILVPPPLPASYRYLQFAVSPMEVFHFKTLPFELSTALLVFTRIVENVAGYMRQMFSLHVHVYLDNWLF